MWYGNLGQIRIAFCTSDQVYMEFKIQVVPTGSLFLFSHHFEASRQASIFMNKYVLYCSIGFIFVSLYIPPQYTNLPVTRASIRIDV